VSRDKFSYEGLKAIDGRIRRLSTEAGYLVIQDRTDRRQDDTLARFNLTAEDAAAYLDLPTVFDDDYDPDDPSEITHEMICEAAAAWVRDVAERNTVGEEWRRFRVRVYAPKGIRLMDSAQFVCRNHEADLDLPVPELPEMPLPTFDEATAVASSKGIKALGDYYAQWGHLVIGSIGQLQGVNQSMIHHLHRQLQDAQEQVDKLVSTLLENRAREAELADAREAEERDSSARTVLAQQALEQLGEAARAFLSTRGLTPELADVLGVIGTSPELMRALSSPDVRALMQDPDNLKGLAAMLEGAAQQARAMREQAANQSITPEDAAA